MRFRKKNTSYNDTPSTMKGQLMSRSSRKKYTLIHFAIDAVLTLLTGGLWLIFVFVRESRKN